MVLVDVSGSMHDRIKGERRRKIEAAQAAAIDLVGAFTRYATAHPDTPVLVGVHEFSARAGAPAAREVIPLGRPNPLTAGDAIRAMKTGGGTPIGEAMAVARLALDRSGLKRRHLLVVTDGENTDGADPALVASVLEKQPEEVKALALLRRLRRRRRGVRAGQERGRAAAAGEERRRAGRDVRRAAERSHPRRGAAHDARKAAHAVTEEKTRVFITGGTGYIGRRLIPVLQQQGCRCGRWSGRLGAQAAAGCEVVVGNPLDRSTFEDAIEPYSAFVQLVGVPHPSPAKAQQFYDIDLVSARASIDAAAARQVDHFVYVSVAQPAPIMKAYQLSRAIAEGHLAQSGLTCSVIRPWYVLGPGHRWPIVLKPFYWIAERRASSAPALRLGLVTIDQMVATLALVVAAPPRTSRILTVPDIRRASL